MSETAVAAARHFHIPAPGARDPQPILSNLHEVGAAMNYVEDPILLHHVLTTPIHHDLFLQVRLSSVLCSHREALVHFCTHLVLSSRCFQAPANNDLACFPRSRGALPMEREKASHVYIEKVSRYVGLVWRYVSRSVGSQGWRCAPRP